MSATRSYTEVSKRLMAREKRERDAVLRAAKRKLVPTEKQVQREVRRLLSLWGASVWDTSQPFKAAITPGLPDLVCFTAKHGLFFVEVKRPGGRQSDAQRAFAARCAEAGVAYVLGGVDEVLEFLNGSRLALDRARPRVEVTITPLATDATAGEE